jgi:dihydrofolate reductase
MKIQPFELLLGRRTYDIWAAYWPRIAADSPGHPIAGPFNRVRKHVATHRPDTLRWQNSSALKGDIADGVRALKQQDGCNLLTWGSGDMVRQLLAADNAEPSAFAVAHSTSTPGGVLLTRYAFEEAE